MKDRFKFRFWNIAEKTMLYDIQFFIDFIDCMGNKNLIPMQATGRKDKNGNLIFENDIVYKKGNKDYKGNKLNSQVVFSQHLCGYCLTDENGIHNIPVNSANIEIVGNIYENRDLVKYIEEGEEDA